MTGSQPGERTVGAVIVHHDASGDLRDCLASLYSGTTRPDEVIVVDNSEQPDHRTAAAAIAEEFSAALIPMDGNVGFAAGCNRGVDALHGARNSGDREPHDRGDCDILFLNQDAMVDSGTLTALCRTLDRDPTVAAVNPLIVTATGRVWFAGGGFNRWLARLSRPGFGSDPGRVEAAGDEGTDWLNGCALLVRAEAWKQAMGFDERYFLYWEDVDLSLRLRSLGWKLAMVPQARVTHRQDRDGRGLRNLTPAVVEHSIRSRLLFVRQQLGVGHRLTAGLYTPMNAGRFVVLSVQQALGTAEVRLGPLLRAVGAGLRGGATD